MEPLTTPMEEAVGAKLTGSKDQLILAISKLDDALGERIKKDRVVDAKLKKILVFIAQETDDVEQQLHDGDHL